MAASVLLLDALQSTSKATEPERLVKIHPKVVTTHLSQLICHHYILIKDAHLRLQIFSITAIALILSACATTDVQQLSQTSFKVSTRGAPVCGSAGTRNVAFRTAAVEVIRRGHDLFIIQGDTTGYDGWSGVSEQGMVVQLIDASSPEAKNALSARQTLGADWQTLVQEGAPVTCTT